MRSARQTKTDKVDRRDRAFQVDAGKAWNSLPPSVSTVDGYI